MGKGDLWDDSALVNAFDEAISNYKKMHKKGYTQTSTTEVVTADVKTTINSNDAYHDDRSHLETVDDADISSHGTIGVKEVTNLRTDKGMEGVNTQVLEEHALGGNSLPLPDLKHQDPNNSSSLDVDEYNQLYKQYYEVEGQRQNILQRLQQLSGLSYSDTGEASVSGLQRGTDSINQAYQTSVGQVPYGAMVVSCCSCTCPCSMASCSSLSCVSPRACVGRIDAPAVKVPEKQPEDVEFVKMAMGSAEKAISSLKDKTFGLKEDKEVCCGMEQSASSETDLDVVLNAWFSAGFHTGKYLTEQTIAKKRHS